MRCLVPSLLVLALSGASAQALHITAASGLPDDLQAAIDEVHEGSGDTVFIPGGVNLIGADPRQKPTVLISHGCHGFIGYDPEYDPDYVMSIGNVIDFRIDHCSTEGFTYQLGVRSQAEYPQSRGVMDHCHFKVPPDQPCAFTFSSSTLGRGQSIRVLHSDWFRRPPRIGRFGGVFAHARCCRPAGPRASRAGRVLVVR